MQFCLIAVSHHKCSESKRGWNSSAHPSRLAHWNPITVYTFLVRVYRRSSAMVSRKREYVTELFSSFERQISRILVVHISWVKASFYENLILKTVIQKSELKNSKLKKKSNRSNRSNLRPRAREANDVPLRQPSCWLKCKISWRIIAKQFNLTELFISSTHV